MDEEDGFGEWLATKMIKAGLQRPVDLARATGINQSLIGRWLRDELVPGMANLARLSPVLGVPVTELAARAGHLGADRPERTQAPHPLVMELARLLPADPTDSPLPQDERLLLEELITRVIDPYRRHLRRRRAG